MTCDQRPDQPQITAESYPAAAITVPAIRHAIVRLLGATSLDPQRKADVLLAVTEAAANAVRHGSTSPTDRIDLEANLRRDSLTVTIRDYGPGIPRDAPSTGPGLGLPLISALADHTELHHAHPGTRATLHFAIQPTAG